MRILTVLMLASLLSCTTVNHNVVVVEQYKYNYIDSEFNPIVQSFVYEARQRGHLVDLTNLSMTFGKIRSKKGDKTVGYCVRDFMGGMVIKIHTPTWKEMGPYQQEELIFHELAHCIMGRDHCSVKDKDGPISILYPKILSEKYYKEKREELVDELFNINPECVGNDGHTNEVDGKVCSPSIRNSGR